MTPEQNKALLLANGWEQNANDTPIEDAPEFVAVCRATAEELRRQHDELLELRADYEATASRLKLFEVELAECEKQEPVGLFVKGKSGGWHHSFDGHEFGEEKDRIPLYTRLAPPAVPDGWQLVPKEPTSEQLDAARDWSLEKNGIGVGNAQATGCYQAMIAAAPQPAQEVQAASYFTESMLQAGLDAMGFNSPLTTKRMREIVDAMLAAAPQENDK